MQTSGMQEGLIRRLRASEQAALREVFCLFRAELVRYVRAIVRDGMVAHDLVQDVFVSLWELRATLAPDCALLAYLYRMARNRAYRHLRDERLHAEKHVEMRQMGREGAGGERPDDGVDAGLLQQKLHAWIADLPERQREALVLSRFHGLSHQEIADVMGISPRTVNNHMVRALEHLHERVRTFESTAL